MAGEIATTLRGPKAYEVARAAIDMMERVSVWPTTLNFDIWLHTVADPTGVLAKEIQRLIEAGEPITEAVSEDLAQNYLPAARLQEQIQDAGSQLTQEMTNVSNVIQAAHRSTQSYGEHLAGASRDLSGQMDEPGLRAVVRDLARATTEAQSQSKQLEKRLADSTAEVGRLREHLVQVRRDATTDGLTGLANRKSFDEELARVCAESDETRQPVCLAVLDIDHFKKFNDTWGHQTGDQVLRYVASVIGRVGAPPRFAARYGGEEFAMIFVGETLTQVRQTLTEVLHEVASRRLRRRSTNDDLGAVTISAGCAERRAREKPTALVGRADEALYVSKHEGRNRVTSAERATEAA